jgi:hypothetical protein
MCADVIGLRSDDDNDIFDTRELAGIEHPIENGAIGDFVKHFALHGVHAFASASSQNDGDDIFHNSDLFLVSRT